MSEAIKKVEVQVWFEGRTTMLIDPSLYPHYFENDKGRGGLAQLAEDSFYDEADFRGTPFIDGATEIFSASFELPEDATS